MENYSLITPISLLITEDISNSFLSLCAAVVKSTDS